jgi:hypothetical protein
MKNLLDDVSEAFNEVCKVCCNESCENYYKILPMRFDYAFKHCPFCGGLLSERKTAIIRDKARRYGFEIDIRTELHCSNCDALPPKTLYNNPITPRVLCEKCLINYNGE